MSMKNWIGVLLLALVSSTAAYQGIRYTQIAAQDRQGNGNQFQMTRSTGTHSGCVQYDLSGNADGTGSPCGSGSGTVTHTGALTSGQLIKGNGADDITVGDLTGDATTSGSLAVTVVKANGTSIAASASADQVLRTTAINVASWTAVPDCDDTLGQHLNYDTTAHTYSCGTSITATTVTSAASLTNNLPVFGAGGQAIASGTRTGNTTAVVTSTGSLTSGNCAKWDANGNAVDSGLACSAATGGTGLVLLETHTASASASLAFTACLSSSYDAYLVTVENIVPSTTGLSVTLVFSTDGGANYDTGSNYYTSQLSWSTGGVGAGGPGTGTAILLFPFTGRTISTTASTSTTGWFYIYGPSGSGFKNVDGEFQSPDSASSNPQALQFRGRYNITTAVNAFKIGVASNNMTSGSIHCYGLAK